MSNENGTSTVASITETADSSSSSTAATAAASGSSSTTTATTRPKKRFLQLYTSKAYNDQRSKLVQPHEEVEEEFDNEQQEQQQYQFVENERTSDGNYNAMGNTSTSASSNSQQLILHNKQQQHKSPHPPIEDDEHVLSPRIVEAVTKSAQVVWANSQSKQQKGGLLGRSDIKLQTAIGMPVGMDDSGHVWVVVMFSPKNIESSSDAIEYLQYIGRSAGSSSIPCLLPVVGESHGSSIKPKMIANGEDEEDDQKISAEQHEQQQSSSQPHYLVSIQPPKSKPSTNIQTTDLLGEGVTAKFVSFNIQDEDNTNDTSSRLSLHPNNHHPRTSSINSINDLRNAPKDDFGIPMLPPDNTATTTSDNILITDAFDEASYGVWSTIMNSAGGNTIRTSTTIASKMGIIRERLEEFLCAFLGMSVFDVGDAWVLSSAEDGEGGFGGGDEYGGGGDDKRKTLKCLFTVAATENNTGINSFREVSGNTSIQIGDGAVGKAFSTGYPVWSSDQVSGEVDK